MARPEPIHEPRRRQRRRAALSPWTRRLFHVVGAGVALLGANGVYLAVVSFLGWRQGASLETAFYLWMFLLHLALGLLLIPPFLMFVLLHLRNTWGWKARRIKRSGLLLFSGCGLVILSGVLMTLRLLPVDSLGGRASYWVHVLVPVLCLFFYILHRTFGPPIKWRRGIVYGVSVALLTGGMLALHWEDPRSWGRRGGGALSFKPAQVQTVTGQRIPAQALMRESYCKECHPDVVRDHLESVHHMSSFNNPVYLFSIREARKVLLARDGNVLGTRFCAGCHDPVPLLSGAFDDPGYDDQQDPTARAGITCTVCHAIVGVAGTIGNANYTIGKPTQYPFATSRDPFLHWINLQLVKAKPAFHKQSFLKPLHKQAAFCTACHKVNIPYALNHYKAWLRGQNLYDSFLLSGISGHSARSFYYPKKAQQNCNECHMPPEVSDDFAAKNGKIHDHRMAGANTALPYLSGDTRQVRFQQRFMQKQVVSIDIFGLKEGGAIDGPLLAPIRPRIPRLKPGQSVLLEVVLRTLKNQGHTFTQGTSDSNNVWVELTARMGGRIIGQSGALDSQGFVDPWAHFVNSLLLDRHGNRIDRRNVQDIFVPLYSHMMGPGTGQVVHYLLKLPAGLKGELEIIARLNYRKFDQGVMTHVRRGLKAAGLKPGNLREIPITTLAEDRVFLPVAGALDGGEGRKLAPQKPRWQRWRDYGIGLLLEGKQGAHKGELRQAEQVFREVVRLGRAEGWTDLARVYEQEGRLEDARHALEQAIESGAPAPWTVNWLAGKIDAQNGFHERAVKSFQRVLDTRLPGRGFDFSLDYQVLIQKGLSEIQVARHRPQGRERRRWLVKSRKSFERVLALDAENVAAHFNLMLIARMLGNEREALRQRRLHARYRTDDNARDQAVARYRAAHPAGNHAAEAIVIYKLSPPR